MIDDKQMKELNLQRCRELTRAMDKDEQIVICDEIPTEIAFNRVAKQLKKDKEFIKALDELIENYHRKV